MKLVKEHINEKFTEESDPIQDMSIGIGGLLKQWANERRLPTITKLNLENLLIYCIDIDEIDFVKYLLKNKKVDPDAKKRRADVGSPLRWAMTNQQKNSLQMVKLLIDAGANPTYANLGNFLWNQKHRIYDDMFNFLIQEITKWSDSHPEKLTEKFVEDSDPIHDMGIGDTINLYDKASKLSPDPHSNSHNWVNFYKIKLPGKHISGYFIESADPDKDYRNEKLNERKKIYKDLKILNVTSYFVDSRNKRHIFIKNIDDNKEYYVCPDEYYVIY